MKVKSRVDFTNGFEYREIIYKNYHRLDQLRNIYSEMGFRTWLNIWDLSKNTWILTVEFGLRYAR